MSDVGAASSEILRPRGNADHREGITGLAGANGSARTDGTLDIDRPLVALVGPSAIAVIGNRAGGGTSRLRRLCAAQVALIVLAVLVQ